jgi:DNA (cytosine-5)-methyltransferase 1
VTDEIGVADFFSGAGGMSYGFHKYPGFSVVGAADAQIGKPSSGPGSLECNRTYAANIGVTPVEVDLASVDPGDLRRAMGVNGVVPILTPCAPCTGFTRTNPKNHLRDDARNSLITKVADLAEEFQPQIILMENARELVMGNFKGHLRKLTSRLRMQGFRVRADTYMLSDFGLPQRRERAVVLAVRGDLPLYGLTDIWGDLRISGKATHVRRAIWDLPPVAAGEVHSEDEMHASPGMNELTRSRLSAIDKDGGSWIDLLHHKDADALMTLAMKKRVERGAWGSHPDVYGRMWWDRPAPTIKRECSHLGNGRYAHPEQDRQCTVRELAILQGFPKEFSFRGSLSNRYRHIGDAVPPLISYQLAALSKWILTGAKPEPEELILPNTHLSVDDLERLPG